MLLKDFRAIGWLLAALTLGSCSDEEAAKRPSSRSDVTGGTGGASEPRGTGGSTQGTGGSAAGTGGALSTGGSTSAAGTSGTGGTTATAGTSGAGTAGSAGSVSAEAPVSLPFVVDEYYAASGGMGDASIAGPVTQTPDTQCMPRPADAVGRCWKVSYRPAQNGWAGFYWQNPVNNWGDKPGLRVAAGAKEVTFYAASNLKGLKVQFLAGGINDPTSGSHNPALYFDPFVVKYIPEAGLGTEFTRYSIALPPTSEPQRILGAFAWTIGAGDPGQIPIPEGQPIELYLDGIEWR